MKNVLIAIVLLLQLPITAKAEIELPVANGTVTSGVGWRVDPFGSGRLIFHRGIDIAVPIGTPVRNVRKGRVVFAGDHHGHGNTVIVEYANGDRTLYGHNSLIRVRPGDMVESRSILAFSGNSGRSTGPHVHFEQVPSGRPVLDESEVEEAIVPQLADNSDQRQALEMIMDESVDAVIRKIRSPSERSENVEHGG